MEKINNLEFLIRNILERVEANELNSDDYMEVDSNEIKTNLPAEYICNLIERHNQNCCLADKISLDHLEISKYKIYSISVISHNTYMTINFPEAWRY